MSDDTITQPDNLQAQAEEESTTVLGFLGFVLGIVSNFYLSLVLGPIAVVLCVLGIFKGQIFWGLLGLLWSAGAILSSPLLLDMALMSLLT
ncbi:hypothetical protein [Marinobacterium weihaiense]|uniref:DUF4190 domain-containing protein n=1 Tax=Marinobacterium weihaiense TaxID=2851016 RepID=A0ABS6MEF3_9GAMM|nr:hypothetical protein [Marinobacterium weihaiense]MBV0934711.1 hypothetical protein [Marinobacterium weihaiense]